jgi:hypothetical protein
MLFIGLCVRWSAFFQQRFDHPAICLCLRFLEFAVPFGIIIIIAPEFDCKEIKLATMLLKVDEMRPHASLLEHAHQLIFSS